MSRSLDEIEDDISHLSDEEREILSVKLLSQVRPGISQEYKRELVNEANRRWEEIESGKVKTIPGKQVIKNIREKLNARRR